MSHVSDNAERLALSLCDLIIERSRLERDALPGSFVKKIKEARVLLHKRQEGKRGNRSADV